MILNDLICTDVLIIGSGLSGLMAAHTLKLPPEMSLSILSTGSGASPNIIGFNIPLHEADTVDCFIDDTLKSGHYQNDIGLVKALCGDSLDLVEILTDIGFKFDRDGEQYALRRPLGSTFPRVAGEGNITGYSISEKIRSKLLLRGNVSLLEPMRALRLMIQRGAVKGVLAYDESMKKFVCIETKAVILAGGGFCNIYPFSTNTNDISGDGIAMMYDAGVPLIDMEFVQFEPTAAVCPEPIRGLGVSTTLCHEGAVLRNINGERFMLKHGPDGEQVNKDLMCKLIYQEILEGKATNLGGVYFDATQVGADRLNDAYDLFVKRYGMYGIDITKEYMEVAPAAHTSLGGVAISQDTSTEIEGLFACGEIVGGIHGANRIGGNAGLETMVFGRRAGIAVSKYIKNIGKTTEPVSKDHWGNWLDTVTGLNIPSKAKIIDPVQMDFIRMRMGALVSGKLNVIREGQAVKAAAVELSQMLSELDSSAAPTDSYGIYQKIRLYNDLTTAYLLALAAFERTQTVGCHIRSDSFGSNEAPYRIRIQKGTNGPVVKKEPL